MKVTHYIARFLQASGVTHAFGVQGGAVVHLFDSLHNQTKINVCYTHHEQSAALAAVSNAKYNKSVGVCITTTGPAASNALTGLLAAWQDSSPVLFISGQTRLDQTSYGLNVRQRGSQECNILDVVKPWTKFSAIVKSPADIPYILRESYSNALEGRPGPVWIDLPVDLQWSDLSPSLYQGYCRETDSDLRNKDSFEEILQIIASSKNPIFVMGRIPYREHVISSFLSVIEGLHIPICSTWGSATISKGTALSSGIIGVSGQPSANYSIRASDCLVFLGCHFSITQSGANFEPLRHSQTHIYINIDQSELDHTSSSCSPLLVKADANDFLEYFIENTDKFDSTLNAANRINWTQYIEHLTDVLSPQRAAHLLNTDESLNPHGFLCSLYQKLSQDDLVVIDGGGCALYAGFQCIPSNAKFSVICSTSISAMGTGLPELCGAGICNSSDSLSICVIGDGSLMFNVQELQTVKTNLNSSLVIVINNSGYLAIRHTQKQFLGGRFYGTSGNGFGVEIPSIKSIAKAFDFEYQALTCNSQIDDFVDKVISSEYKHRHLLVELTVSASHSNLFTASFRKDSGQNNYTQQGLHLMEPFATFDYSFALS